MFYLTGTSTQKTENDAISVVKRSPTMAVIRGNVINWVSRSPIQPGQAEFRIRSGEIVYNAWAEGNR